MLLRLSSAAAVRGKLNSGLQSLLAECVRIAQSSSRSYMSSRSGIITSKAAELLLDRCRILETGCVVGLPAGLRGIERLRRRGCINASSVLSASLFRLTDGNGGGKTGSRLKRSLAVSWGVGGNTGADKPGRLRLSA